MEVFDHRVSRSKVWFLFDGCSELSQLLLDVSHDDALHALGLHHLQSADTGACVVTRQSDGGEIGSSVSQESKVRTEAMLAFPEPRHKNVIGDQRGIRSKLDERVPLFQIDCLNLCPPTRTDC